MALYIGDEPSRLTKVFVTRLERAHTGWFEFGMAQCTLAPHAFVPQPEPGGAAALTAKCFHFELLSVHRARKSYVPLPCSVLPRAVLCCAVLCCAVCCTLCAVRCVLCELTAMLWCGGGGGGGGAAARMCTSIRSQCTRRTANSV